MRTHKQRRTAALKGWRTRRANQAKRSAIARKGWKTRRAKQRAVKEIAEFVVHFEYGERSTKKGDQYIRFQVHVIGPKGATDAEAIEAIRQRNEGEDWPKGWKLREINWSKRNHITRIDPLPPYLRESAIAGGVSNIANRKNRRVRK